MNSRERVICAIEHRIPDRVPKYDSFWDTTLAEFQKQGMPPLPPVPAIDADGIRKPAGNPAGDFFGFDIDAMYMDISMRLPTEVLADDGERYIVRDRYGWTAQKYKGRSSSMRFLDHTVKTRADWDRLKGGMTLDPSAPARLDSESYYIHLSPYPSWKGAAALYNAFRGRGKYLMFACYGPHECTWRHHGYEASLMDMIEEPLWMDEMYGQTVELIIATLEHAISLGIKPDGLFVCEDMGEMRSTLFSPEVYKSLLFPHHRRIAEFLHKHSIHFIMHSDGRIDSLVPLLVEAGVDVLQPLQANTGLDVAELKEKYGNGISFFGNIGVEAFRAGKDAIRNEILRKVPAAMKGGGYLYHSDHSVPPDVTYETYRYCIELVDAAGVYPRVPAFTFSGK